MSSMSWRPTTWALPLLLSVLFGSLLLSCNPDRNLSDPCAEVKAWEITHELIGEYHRAHLPVSASQPQGAPSVFVDFSNGLVQAYQGNPKNGEMINAIAGKLIDPAITWHSMAAGTITSMAGMRNTALFTQVTDPRSYSKEIMAPIQATLDTITRGDREALLVTDFEEYETDGKEKFFPYAKDHFKRWMLKGNRITLFANNYSEKTKDKRLVDKQLYFVVFSVGSGEGEKNLLTLVQKALEGRVSPDHRLDLYNKPFSAATAYTKEGEGGIYYNTKAATSAARNPFEMDQSLFVDGSKKGDAFEFYPLGMSWSYVDQVQTAEKQEGLTYFLSGLKVNAAGNDAYAFGGLGLRVCDVSEDFQRFACCAEVPKHKPETVVDPDKGHVRFSDAQKEKADPIAELCYDSIGTMKPEWAYSPPAALTEVPEVFQLNEELLANQLKADPKAVEARILFHPNFKGDGPVGAVRLLRVDVVVAQSQDLATDPRLEAYKWSSTTVKDKVNESLYTSLRETLQDPDLKPEKVQPVLHTYYILTTEPQK